MGSSPEFLPLLKRLLPCLSPGCVDSFAQPTDTTLTGWTYHDAHASPAFHGAPELLERATVDPFRVREPFFLVLLSVGKKTTAIHGSPLQGNRNASGPSYVEATASSK